MNSSDSSDSEDELGTSASVQEEKREFEAGLSDLRHKLAQEVILEEEEGKSKALSKGWQSTVSSLPMLQAWMSNQTIFYQKPNQRVRSPTLINLNLEWWNSVEVGNRWT